MLDIKHVSYAYSHDQKVLSDLSLQVNDGEFVSILGPSGSGKSTLFHLIGGLYRPERGEILLDGREIIGEKGHISYMPQQPALLPWRSVLDNVVLGAELASKKADKDEAKKLLEKAGLAEYANALPHQLSGGMKQRVAFLRSLASPQKLMLLDEPFSALDELTRLSMQNWLLNVWEKNRRSVLFITHSIEEAIYLSDTIYVLSSKPASIVTKVAVPFARPRREEMALEPAFIQLKQELYALLKER